MTLTKQTRRMPAVMAVSLKVASVIPAPAT